MTCINRLEEQGQAERVCPAPKKFSSFLAAKIRLPLYNTTHWSFLQSMTFRSKIASEPNLMMMDS